eukprot:snap_masked-scaffold_18-processed-gene-5.34-mRNA-1 protein AED:1.00 eAED:1.00 QI:0/-1/0/0/-1/1/1/0/157
MAQTFYRSSNEVYGNFHGKDKRRAEKRTGKLGKILLKKACGLHRPHCCESNVYGNFEDPERNLLTKQMSAYLQAKSYKVPPAKPATKPKANIHYYKQDLSKLKHDPQKQNPLKTTTSNDIGLVKPNPLIDGAGVCFPHTSKFSQSFVEMYKETGLQI